MEKGNKTFQERDWKGYERERTYGTAENDQV